MNDSCSQQTEHLDGELLASEVHANYDDLKRRIRKLKKLEIKIRFGDKWTTGCASPPGSRRSGDHWQTRASASGHRQALLVWDDFFDLNETVHIPVSKLASKPAGKPANKPASKPSVKSGDQPQDQPADKPARYTLKQLATMSKEAYKEVVSEFFWNVYYRYYRENGIMDRYAYDPDILSQLGLPFDADSQTIKKRFRDLAKRYHPDAGGNAAQFIEFMEQFKKLDSH